MSIMFSCVKKIFRKNESRSKGYCALVCHRVGKTIKKSLYCASTMLILMSAFVNAETTAEKQTVYSIDLPAQSVAKSLSELSEQTDQMLLFSYDVAENLEANSVVGKYTIAEALRIMLKGTGFSGSLTSKGVLMISLTKSEASNVVDEKTKERKAMNKRRSIWAATIAFFMALGGTNAVAQGEDDSAKNPDFMLEEIIVTAQRRTENLQDVPISVQAFSGDTIDRAGIESTADLGILTPGLVYTKGVGLGSPFLRGIGTLGNGPGTENSIAIYVDEVYIASKTSALTELANVERVEVLKGPQGTLFGRNATGGLIQIITKQPPAEPEGRFKLGYGNYDTVTASASVGGPLTDKLGAVMSINYKDQNEGFGVNLGTGNDVNREESLSGRVKFSYQPSDATRITLIGAYSETENSIGTAYRLLGDAVPRLGPTFVMPPNAGDYDVNGNADPFYDGDDNQFSLKIEHDMGFAVFKSISAYQTSDYFFVLDSDITPEPNLYITVANDEKQFSQELQLSSNSDAGLEWTAGLYAYFGEGEQTLTLEGDAFPTLQQIANTGSQDTSSYAVYGQATQQFGEKTRFTAGLRYTIDEREIGGQRGSFALDGTFSATPIEPAEADFEKLTWRLALDYQLSPDALLYVSYNRGFKSGLFNAGSLQLDPVLPEVLDAYEIGVKSELFDQRLRFNTTAFYYDFEDIQLTQFALGIATLRNAAKAEVYGFEFDSEFIMTRDLSLVAGLSLLDGSFKSFPGAGFAVPNPAGGNTVTPGDATGNELVRTPRLTATAALNYSTAIAYNNTFSFNLNYSYNDGFYVEPDNVLKQDAYSLINARAQLGFSGDRVLVSLWATNLTDKFYTTALTAQAVGLAYAAAEPRRYGLTVEYRY